MPCLCDNCAGLCCRYFALEIDKPETARQFDDIRWYLCHENVVVFIEKKRWYLGIMSRCKHLQSDNRCGIYEKRPKICREYSTTNCDFRGGDYEYEELFTSADQLASYAKKALAARRRDRARHTTAKRRSAKPAVRPSRPRLMLDLKGRGQSRIPLPPMGFPLGDGNGHGRVALPVLGARN